MTASGPAETGRFRSLKLADWPEIDRRLLQEARKPKAFLRAGGAAAEWRATTLETVIYRNGAFLWWLRETGRLIPGSSPLERVTQDNIEAFIEAYGACHASVSLAGVMHGVYEAVRVMHPDAALNDLLHTVAEVKADAKPRPKVRRMADQRSLSALGEALIEHGAKRVNEGHMPSATAVRDGCVILFLVECPIRRTNLEALQLGRSLLRDDLGYHVAFGPDDMKNHQPFEAGLPVELGAHLDFYVDVARPVLLARSGKADEGWLWLGAGGEHMLGKSLSRHIRELTAKHLGRPMSAHLFRNSVVTTIAVRHSAQIGIAGHVLGHARHATSEKHYNQAGSSAAVRRNQELLKRERGSNSGRK